MQTVAFIAQKGGTGKTSLALALAVCADNAGQITVILDIDPQATACNWHDRRRHAAAPGRQRRATGPPPAHMCHGCCARC